MPDCMVKAVKSTAEEQGKQTLGMKPSRIKKFPLSNGKCGRSSYWENRADILPLGMLLAVLSTFGYFLKFAGKEVLMGNIYM